MIENDLLEEDLGKIDFPVNLLPLSDIIFLRLSTVDDVIKLKGH